MAIPKAEFDALLNRLKSNNFRAINYRTGLNQSSENEGAAFWNDTEHTLNLVSGLGPILQVGQEQYILVFNNTGVQIDNGKLTRIDGASGNDPTISLAKGDSPVTADQLIGMATMNIPDQTIGIVTTFGKVRDIDTSGCSAGDIIYLSATSAGDFTNTQPVYPNYIMQVGQCITSDVSNGVIFIKAIGRIEDILENGWNGGFLETIKFSVASNGATITGTLENDDNSRNLTMNFSTGFEVLDTTTSPVTIALTPGADNNPQVNYIYVPISTKVLTVSTSDWPAEQHIKIALVSVRTAATTQTDGALRNQNWNDHVADSNFSMGHIQHIAERVRQDDAKWSSGAEGTLSIVTQALAPDDLFVSNTSGKVYQLHRQTFPAQDMSTGDDIHVVNDSVAPYKTITNLNSELTDASGGSLDNRYYSLVIWGIANRSGEISHLMCNLPINSYNTSSGAQSDALNYSVYDIPAQFRGTGFLIARFTVKHAPAASGTWTLEATQDLRGFVSNTTAGGGAGGGGVSTFTGLTDTPSAYTSQALKIPQVNAGETALEFLDPTTDFLSQYSLVDGSKAFTGAVGGVSPTLGSHLSTKDYVDNLVEGLKWKQSCLVTTIGNITLSGEQTIDGVLTSSSRVLVKDQTDGTENGIYVSNSGAWSRSSDADSGIELVSAAVNIEQGTINADVMFVCTNNSITIGVTNIVFITLGSTISHNNTTGLQGGTTNEFYHLTSAQHSGLTGGGDTTLHDHDGISENTAARHTQNTDTALGSGAVAADHGTAATDQIINVSYGTSATPPIASTTTEGSLYVQYTA